MDVQQQGVFIEASDDAIVDLSGVKLKDGSRTLPLPLPLLLAQTYRYLRRLPLIPTRTPAATPAATPAPTPTATATPTPNQDGGCNSASFTCGEWRPKASYPLLTGTGTRALLSMQGRG